MPQPAAVPGQKKKKKGRAPAHQNKFAFRHNPKSKTTERILSSPIYHVCQRCHDKLEWRKQYRKYKPLTQPGTCNGCKQRNVKAAYHTICESCTITSDKAKALIKAELESIKAKKSMESNEGVREGGTEAEGKAEAEEEEEIDLPKLRACAICVKEIALPDPTDEKEVSELELAAGRLKLRELKTLERQIEREAKEARKAARNKDGDGNGDENDDDDGTDEEGPNGDDDEEDGDDDVEQEEMDPFLQAVGGADKLLTGEAYQKKLLEQQQQQLSSQAN